MDMEAFTYKHIAQQAERMSAIEEKLDCMTQFCPQRYSKIDHSSAHNLTSKVIVALLLNGTILLVQKSYNK